MLFNWRYKYWFRTWSDKVSSLWSRAGRKSSRLLRNLSSLGSSCTVGHMRVLSMHKPHRFLEAVTLVSFGYIVPPPSYRNNNKKRYFPSRIALTNHSRDSFLPPTYLMRFLVFSFKKDWASAKEWTLRQFAMIVPSQLWECLNCNAKWGYRPQLSQRYYKRNTTL